MSEAILPMVTGVTKCFIKYQCTVQCNFFHTITYNTKSNESLCVETKYFESIQKQKYKFYKSIRQIYFSVLQPLASCNAPIKRILKNNGVTLPPCGGGRREYENTHSFSACVVRGD